MYDFSGLSALIVDDVHATRALIRGLLRVQGLTDVREARNGVEALDILQTERRNLVITDLRMQPMDGLELTRRLRRPGATIDPYIPVLMLSAHAEEVSVRAAVRAGVTEYLVKPVSPGALYERLRAIVERPRPLVRLEAYFGPDRRRGAVRP